MLCHGLGLHTMDKGLSNAGLASAYDMPLSVKHEARLTVPLQATVCNTLPLVFLPSHDTFFFLFVVN